MKLQRKILSLILALSTLICCFTNLYVKASDIDASNLTYVVDNMTFYNGETGQTQVGFLSFATYVGVDVTEQIETNEDNTVIIAAYSADGTFISTTSSTKSFTQGKTETIKLKLDIPEGKTVSEVRAFIWKSFDSMIPLSNTLSSNNNMIIVPRPDYGYKTRFAVVTEGGAVPTWVDNEDCFYEIEVLYGSNDVTNLIATDEDETDLLALKAGDIIFFKTNAAGQIKDLDVIFSFDDGIPTYAELASMSLVDDNEDNCVDGITVTSTGTKFGTGVFTQDWDAIATDTVKLVYGPIAEVSKNSISFAIIDNGETDLDTDVQEYAIAPEINVYKYDFGSRARFKFSATTKTTGEAIENPSYVVENNVITWNENSNNTKANFAFALVVEDEVVEIFEFIAK